MTYTQDSNIIFVGVDGGASKVSCLAVETAPDNFFTQIGNTVTLAYSDQEDFDSKFKPVDLQTQLNELATETFDLTQGEKNQGLAILRSISQCIAKLTVEFPNKPALIGIGFPGLKTKNGLGIGALANGPRIPDFGIKLESMLKDLGVKMSDSLKKIGSDADFCGVGENYSRLGNFRNIENGYYLGGGTGVADALKLNGHLITFDSAKEWIAKTWEFRSHENLSMERYISAGGIQYLYSRESGRDLNELTSAGVFSNEILELAKSGDSAADKTIKLVMNSLAVIFHERITTLYSGFKSPLKFMNENKTPLLRSHKFTGALLNRIVIGQRLSSFISLVRKDGIYWNSFLTNLGESLLIEKDEVIKHYLRNGIFNDDLIICSNLREAPAIGAAISRVT